MSLASASAAPRAATALPPAIYLLSLCSFAFGLSEFIAAGMLSGMARDLHASVAAAGGAIAAYALGAAIGAPMLTAMLARRPTRQVLVATMAVLAVGSLGMAQAPALGALLGVRFVVGISLHPSRHKKSQPAGWLFVFDRRPSLPSTHAHHFLVTTRTISRHLFE